MKIIEIPFTDRYKYLSATEISSIVKHYGNKSFNVFNSIDFIYSIKKWSEEDRKQYNEILQKNMGFLFQSGKDYENQVYQQLYDKYTNNNNYELIDYSKGEVSLAYPELNISATPDFLVYHKLKNIKQVIETKATSITTDKLQSYKYQLVQQILILQGQSQDNSSWIGEIWFKNFDSVEQSKVVITPKDYEIIKKEILEYSSKFWQDFKNDNFKFISFDDWKESVKQKEEELIEDKILIAEIEKIRLSEYYVAEAEQAKQFLRDGYNNKKLCYNSTDGKIIVTISKASEKEIIYDSNYYEREINKKQIEADQLRILYKATLDNSSIIKKEVKKICSRIIINVIN